MLNDVRWDEKKKRLKIVVENWGWLYEKIENFSKM